ncbi:MAG: hypothetical protein PHT31_03005 [Candidatus Omnitrophica bacterium]|nr:hypothetical protein [Candidatus Omnitrophota bacterium]MDD5653116.1 hypothetical protein [Candidatus Omnitrophota bacterium]
MMKSKPSLRNLARAVLSLIILSGFICGCTSSTTPTYLKEDIPKAVQDICKKEYKIDVVVKQIGTTLWIYMPVGQLLEKNPQKFTEKFTILSDDVQYQQKSFEITYHIKPHPDREKTNDYKYSKDVLDKVNDIWMVLRRVIFSTEASDKAPQFFYLVVADTKNTFDIFGQKFGLEIEQLTYYPDFKKVFYGLISITEYQHRSIQESDKIPAEEIINDTQGEHLKYREITMAEFLTKQIKQRLELKFEKPEVGRNIDIDKEIENLSSLTLKIYDFRDFNEVELHNLATKNRIILNRAAVLEKPIE